ncbi:polyprenyl synthetase family protein [Pseudonocardia acaciae]|uniref:polyprenyl synthetase family protein n=1 Tax=Pseudonocardia acaciae TaxID=551276 RepID=UPI00048C22AB|nr:polyprenyl synthetase family protein [Pseudonocardia acaciae]
MNTGPIDDHLVERVDATLADYLARRRELTEAIHPVVDDAAATLAGFVKGGKRVRPTFAWWGWRGAGGDPGGQRAEAVLTAISPLELVQANALIHDDLMDASATRRGRPTVHVDFAGRHREHGWLGDPERFGAAAAILLGDLALAWADDMFDSAALPERALRRARPVWAGMRTEMIGGQFLDVWGQATGNGSAEAALRVNRFKTAAYTVERPLELGAALAGAGPELVAAYRRFGSDIGIAFQLRDDLLGVLGDPAVTGKPAGDDLREGKRTVLMALAGQAARERRNQTAAATLERALGDPELDESGVARVREVLHELGTPEELERRIERLTDSALAALDAVELTPPSDTRLPELARAAARRLS